MARLCLLYWPISQWICFVSSELIRTQMPCVYVKFHIIKYVMQPLLNEVASEILYVILCFMNKSHFKSVQECTRMSQMPFKHTSDLFFTKVWFYNFDFDPLRTESKDFDLSSFLIFGVVNLWLWPKSHFFQGNLPLCQFLPSYSNLHTYFPCLQDTAFTFLDTY